jgi:protein involved in polysaccharide export with SLBB domain
MIGVSAVAELFASKEAGPSMTRRSLSPAGAGRPWARSAKGFVALVSCVLTAACAAAPSEPYGAPRASAQPSGASLAFDPWREEDYHYRLAAGDEIAVRFIVTPDLNASVVIGPDGRGVFPLIGAVRVSGLTSDQADRVLGQAYAGVLRNPQLEVLVTAYSASQFYIGGEVKEPGAKAMKAEISLTQAVLTAGGFTDAARSGKVVVLRTHPGDPRPQLRVVDVKAVLHDGAADVVVRPGDVVFVPRSAIGEVDLFVKQYITDLIPFGFSYGISANGAF